MNFHNRNKVLAFSTRFHLLLNAICNFGPTCLSFGAISAWICPVMFDVTMPVAINRLPAFARGAGVATCAVVAGGAVASVLTGNGILRLINP